MFYVLFHAATLKISGTSVTSSVTSSTDFNCMCCFCYFHYFPITFFFFYQTDFDDGHCPLWSNQLLGLYNIYQFVHGKMTGGLRVLCGCYTLCSFTIMQLICCIVNFYRRDHMNRAVKFSYVNVFFFLLRKKNRKQIS